MKIQSKKKINKITSNLKTRKNKINKKTKKDGKTNRIMKKIIKKTKKNHHGGGRGAPGEEDEEGEEGEQYEQYGQYEEGEEYEQYGQYEEDEEAEQGQQGQENCEDKTEDKTDKEEYKKCMAKKIANLFTSLRDEKEENDAEMDPVETYPVDLQKIGDFCNGNGLPNILSLMNLMFSEEEKKATITGKPQKNVFSYGYKPSSEWKDTLLANPKKIYEWYLLKNPNFLPILRQNKEEIYRIEQKADTEIYASEQEYRNKLAKEHKAPALSCGAQLQFQSKIKRKRKGADLNNTENNREANNNQKDYLPKIDRFYPWESSKLEQVSYPVIKVEEYAFLVMGMVKDLLLLQFLSKMPKAPHKVEKKSYNNLNARISKRLDGAKIPTDISQLAFKLLQLFEKLIKEGYVYAEFISCLSKYLLLFSVGNSQAHTSLLRAVIDFLKSSLNTCFIIFPTFEQVNYKKVVNFCAAPVLNFRLSNHRLMIHGDELSLTDEIFHDLVNHGFSTHQITKYIPGYIGHYFQGHSFRLNDKFKYKYQPTEIRNIFALRKERLSNLFPSYDYDVTLLSNSEMNESGFIKAVDSDDLTNEEKFIFACMLFFAFHEMRTYCLHDLNFNSDGINMNFSYLLRKRNRAESRNTQRLRELLCSPQQYQFMQRIFDRESLARGEYDEILLGLIKKCLKPLQDFEVQQKSLKALAKRVARWQKESEKRKGMS